MGKYQVIFFEKESGEAPALDFINSLDDKMAQNYGSRIRNILMTVSLNFVQKLAQILALFCIFLCGKPCDCYECFYQKNTKMPKSELDKAKAFRTEYREKERSLHHENA